MRTSIAPNVILEPYNLSDKMRGMMAEIFGYTIPLEVKSSDNVKAKSLQTYIKKYSPKCSIRISSKNFGNENGIIFIPLYVIFCLKDENKWN